MKGKLHPQIKLKECERLNESGETKQNSKKPNPKKIQSNQIKIKMKL